MSSPTSDPRQPKCSRCRHHGIVIPKKGHTKLCPFRSCECWKCYLITQRTRTVALHRNLAKARNTAGAKPRPGTGGSNPAVGGSSDAGAPGQVFVVRGSLEEPRSVLSPSAGVPWITGARPVVLTREGPRVPASTAEMFPLQPPFFIFLSGCQLFPPATTTRLQTSCSPYPACLLLLQGFTMASLAPSCSPTSSTTILLPQNLLHQLITGRSSSPSRDSQKELMWRQP